MAGENKLLALLERIEANAHRSQEIGRHFSMAGELSLAADAEENAYKMMMAAADLRVLIARAEQPK